MVRARGAGAAPTARAGRDLLYDLGRLLADTGETERALAVFLELQADAPDYRDVALQVERLSQKSVSAAPVDPTPLRRVLPRGGPAARLRAVVRLLGAQLLRAHRARLVRVMR